MLKLNKELTRASGGEIETGSIILYKIATESRSNEITIVFEIYQNAQAVINNKIPIPYQDIEELYNESGDAIHGGRTTPSPLTIPELGEDALIVDLTDEIVKEYLELNFFGANCITKLGDSFPE